VSVMRVSLWSSDPHSLTFSKAMILGTSRHRILEVLQGMDELWVCRGLGTVHDLGELILSQLRRQYILK
jgi:hypothetical protein